MSKSRNPTSLGCRVMTRTKGPSVRRVITAVTLGLLRLRLQQRLIRLRLKTANNERRMTSSRWRKFLPSFRERRIVCACLRVCVRKSVEVVLVYNMYCVRVCVAVEKLPLSLLSSIPKLRYYFYCLLLLVLLLLDIACKYLPLVLPYYYY